MELNIYFIDNCKLLLYTPSSHMEKIIYPTSKCNECVYGILYKFYFCIFKKYLYSKNTN